MKPYRSHAPRGDNKPTVFLITTQSMMENTFTVHVWLSRQAQIICQEIISSSAIKHAETPARWRRVIMKRHQRSRYSLLREAVIHYLKSIWEKKQNRGGRKDCECLSVAGPDCCLREATMNDAKCSSFSKRVQTERRNLCRNVNKYMYSRSALGVQS